MMTGNFLGLVKSVHIPFVIWEMLKKPCVKGSFQHLTLQSSCLFVDAHPSYPWYQLFASSGSYHRSS